MKVMRYMVRALTGVDILASMISIGQRGPTFWSALALLVGIALTAAFLVADGAIGTWRETRDAEEELLRRILEENRGRVIIIMMHPMDPNKVFPADKAEIEKEEKGEDDG